MVQEDAARPGLAEFPRAGASYPTTNEPAYPPASGPAYPPANGPYPPINGPIYPPAGNTTYPGAGITSHNGPVSYTQPPAYGQSLPPVGYPPYMAPGKPKRRINPLFIALGVVLVVLVALCGILAVTLSSAMAPISHSSSSNTASASQTPLPAPTGKAIINDNFGDNNNNWNLFQAAGYGASIQKHTLVMSEGNGKIFLEHVPGAQSVANFRLDMTYTQLQDNNQAYVGALFRRQSMPTSQGFRGYELKIAASSGQYAIRKVVDPPANHAPGEVNAAINLASGSLDNTVQPDKSIQTTLIVQGTSITLYVNGKLVTTCDDSSSTAPYDTGSVNLLLQGGDNGIPAKVAFSHFALYDTGSSGPSI
ncbi:hypothetical protein KSZ_73290 [Dictyobacter formicarum]|uniref:3-keto-alpha-glucoside-1,2-lyase/3-keto-2-hydroxy-glucal hydratase domain-containing protein n=2 Tax=Dictyobacter formicarum TaxID=2778368 RepID=A0ABQ3VU24_9CHLR|nr:hypothetical protein KSZ_73290 [Dictyobacter formicarum]